jgi:multidrug efflux pump subunit AcrA (membrane-fusion protein)
MDLEQPVPAEENKSTVLRNVLLAVAIVYVVVSLYFIISQHNDLANLESAVKQQQAAQDRLQQEVAATSRDLKTSTEALAQRLGMTEQDLQARMAARAADLERQQRAAERRLTEQEKASINQVNGEVSGVKTDLGATKTDLETTKTDLKATEAKLESTIGDLGLQSGLIARTRDDLDQLRHRGDRNYFEFTLHRGAHPTPISTVSLALKKVDAKHNKFTLNVMADDRTIEKKDRTVAEPMQFYTGRDHMLYEIVVFTVNKNTVTGYVSTPKSAPAPVTTAPSS